MKNPFIKHPNSVGESYFGHMIHSLSYSMKFLCLCIMTFIHAFFPFIFENTSSKLVKKISEHLDNRLCHNPKNKN